MFNIAELCLKRARHFSAEESAYIGSRVGRRAVIAHLKGLKRKRGFHNINACLVEVRLRHG